MRTNSIVNQFIRILAISAISVVTCSALPHKDLNEYGHWLSFHNLDNRDFEKTSEPKELSFSWEDYDLDTTFTNLYQALFIYSPDSSFFIDMDSYSLHLEKEDNGSYSSSGGDVDTKVQLVDTRSKQTLDIIFCGTQCYSETAVWFTDYLFQISGFRMNEAGEYIPTLLRIDIKKNLIWYFESVHHFKKKPASYAHAFRYTFIKFKD